MDPYARRALWSALQAGREGRAIVLSTHAMEEADALCTHIAIMVRGRLRCFGSPQVSVYPIPSEITITTVTMVVA